MKTITRLDKMYMKQALRLASLGIYTAYPNPAVGCVIVRDGKIIGQGYHHKAGEPHAEVMAIRDAHEDVLGACVYVTLEPCSHYGRTPPCAQKLIDMQVKRVVICCRDPNPKVCGRGQKMLEEAGIEVVNGVYEKKGLMLNRAFMKAVTSGIPYVTLKVGMSLDAKSALSTLESKWITSVFSRSRVQDLRARCDCIITGSGTVIADDPSLNVRYAELPLKTKRKVDAKHLRQPLKVILDGQKRIDYSLYHLFAEGNNLLVRGTLDPSLYETLEPLNEHTSVLNMPYAKELPHADKTAAEHYGIALKPLLLYLGRLGIRNVLVEAGATLVSSFLDADLYDELYVFMAPKLLGMQSRSAFTTKEVSSLDKVQDMTLVKTSSLGDDVLLHYLKKV